MAPTWSLQEGPGSRREAVIQLFDQCGGDLPQPAVPSLAALCVDAIVDGDHATISAALRRLQRIVRKQKRGDESNPATFTGQGRAEAFMGLLSAAQDRTVPKSELNCNATGVAFLVALAQGDCVSSNELSDRLGLSQAEVEHIGSQLEDAAVARRRNLGTAVFWELTTRGLRTLEANSK
jgi:hypothetical protein